MRSNDGIQQLRHSPKCSQVVSADVLTPVDVEVDNLEQGSGRFGYLLYNGFQAFLIESLLDS